MSPTLKSSKLAQRSNLQSFIYSVTPTVPSRLINKSCIDATTLLHTTAAETVESFALGDLWKVYDKCSAYGHGVPVLFDKAEVAVQYYTPLLSGIQLYTTIPSPLIRTTSEEVDELWSAGSEEEDNSRGSNDSGKAWDALSFDSANDQDAPLAVKDPRGYLYFEYFESCSPYVRPPLVDKVLDLAPKFPGLCTLRSVDLAPASWMCVAWYPIYHIPARLPNRDLPACFLSYHTLSASFQDEDLAIAGGMFGGKPKRKGYTSLMPFGLSTYRLDGDFWLDGANDCDTVLHLYSAADSWLKQLKVKQHHDFNFFAKHSPLDVCPLITAP